MHSEWPWRIAGFLLIGAIGLLWEIASNVPLVNPVYLPPVSRVADAFAKLLLSGVLVHHLLASSGRFVVGYAIAVLVGVGIGVTIGYFRRAYLLLEPLIELLRPLPAPAIIPIAILFLGIEDRMRVFVIAFACVFPILVNAAQGAAGVDPTLINTARMLGYGPLGILTRIVFPFAAPTIWAGMRIALAVALILTVVAEFIASNDGIGFLILDAERSFRIPDMYAALFTLMLVGYGLNRIFVLIERRALRWHFRERPGAGTLRKVRSPSVTGAGMY